MTARTSLSALALVLLAACSVQTTQPAPAPTPAPTTEQPPAEGPPAETPCESRTLPSGSAKAMFGKDGSGADAWLYRANGSGVKLSLEAYGAVGGPLAAGEYTLKADDASYDTCALCIVVETDCTASGCKKTFMPEPGAKVRFTSLSRRVGGDFAGELPALTLREVTVLPDGSTVPVAGGARICAPKLPFAAKMEELPAECGGHGHSHGDHCHCDDGYVVDPKDPMNCIAG